MLFRRRSSEAPRRPRRRIRRLRLSLLLLVLGLCGLAALSFGFVTAIAHDIPSIDPSNPDNRVEKQGYIYAADGRVLAVLRGDEARVIVDGDEISPIMKQAIVAVEDRRFWEHRGVDLRGIFRAVWADIRHQEVIQGGSTITQQLVKNTYIEPERTVSRKLKEAALAWQLERRWSKERILTAYLNTIYFGNGAYGIGMAARVYFQKTASELTLPEAALLAGIPANPTAYDPIANPMRAQARRDTVLTLMFGQGLITKAQLDAAQQAPLPSPDQVKLPGTRGPEQYFAEYVKSQLIPYYGSGKVFGGGLKVYTTIDLDLQRLAREAVEKWLPDPNGPQAALVAIDPRDGKVLAMIGGSSFSKSEFNLAVHGERQPGSSFKPFVLATALSQGISPADHVRVEASGALARRQALGGQQLRERVPRDDQPREGDDRLRQHRLRPADRRHRAAERRPHGPPPRHRLPARGLSRDRPGRRGSQPARDGPGVLRVRQRREPCRRLAARERPAGRARGAGRQTARPQRAGEAPGADAEQRGDPQLDPAGGRHPGNGSTGGARRPAGCRQDGDDRELRRRLVRRLHAELWPSRSGSGYPDRLQPMLHEFDGGPVAGGTYPALIFKTFAKSAVNLLHQEPQSFDAPTYPSAASYLVTYRDGGWLRDNGLCRDTHSLVFFSGSAPDTVADCKPNEVSVPNVVGAKLLDAQTRLAAQPLESDVIFQPAQPGIDRPGIVLKQEPIGGTLGSFETVRLVRREGNG